MAGMVAKVGAAVKSMVRNKLSGTALRYSFCLQKTRTTTKLYFVFRNGMFNER